MRAYLDAGFLLALPRGRHFPVDLHGLGERLSSGHLLEQPKHRSSAISAHAPSGAGLFAGGDIPIEFRSEGKGRGARGGNPSSPGFALA